MRLYRILVLLIIIELTFGFLPIRSLNNKLTSYCLKAKKKDMQATNFTPASEQSLSQAISSDHPAKIAKTSSKNDGNQLTEIAVANPELPAGPSILNVSTSTSLLEQFSDVSSTLTLPFLSGLTPTHRFEVREFEGSTQYYFDYNVRESFGLLLKEVQALVSQWRNGAIRYVGNVGAGKSHNLATLVVYLRKSGFDKTVVYISSCPLFFEISDMPALQEVLIDAFPEDTALLKSMTTTDQFVAYIHQKPKQSILFIFDDWNYVCAEPKLSAFDNKMRDSFRDLLLLLSMYQYRIEGISGFTALLTSTSTADLNPIATRYVYLHGGLTDREWAARKARSAFISSLSEEEEARLRDYTGGVPLYLTAIESYEGNFSERMAMFHKYKGINIVDSLEHSSREYAAVDERKFLRQMRYAVNSEGEYLDESLYDHRYFYRDSGFMLRPVSGFVRETMRAILREYATKAYYRQLDQPWIDKAMTIGNDAVKEFAFKTYAVYAVTRDPSRYLDGVLHDIAECTVKYFDGNYPSSNYISYNSGPGLTLFRPTQSSPLRYVDAVARYVPEQGSEAGVTIYPIYATLQSFTANKQATKLFNDVDGQACDALQYIHPDEVSKARFVMTWLGPESSESARLTAGELPPLSLDQDLKCSSEARYVEITRDLSWGRVQVITDEYSY